VLISGTGSQDYQYFDPTPLISAFSGVLVIPQISVSPIEPVYTDGSSNLVLVTLISANTAQTTFPSAGLDGFTLRVQPAPSNVYVQPSIMEFTAAKSATSGALISNFTLTHTQPSKLNGMTSYTLQYFIKYAGWTTNEQEVTAFIPEYAQQVLLRRYSIIPSFPNVLGFDWEPASFNVTRLNQAHFALVPRAPPVDGTIDKYGSDYTAGGHVVFDPPVIVFEPLQQVQNFWVKAIRGNDESSVYYRVEWQIVGHADDTNNYIEWQQSSSPYQFALWFVAPASTLSASLIALPFVVLALLL